MLFDRLSLQSKLVLMLLSVSVGSILVISALGYIDGKRGLTHAVENQLAGMRETRSNQVEATLNVLRNQALTLAVEEGTINAFKSFRDAFRDLDASRVTREMDAALAEFYTKTFLPALSKDLGTTPVVESYLPTGAAARQLQYQYLAKNPKKAYADFDQFNGADGDPGRYAEVHRRYHPTFRDVVRKFQFEDLLLVDADTGDVVYSMQKATDFATNLRDGPYKATAPAALVASIRRSHDRRDYKLADFEFYQPNLGLPSAFLATPLFDGPKLIGVLVLQFPSEEINRVMTGNKEWTLEGLGETGETYLVGPDELLRSRTRLFERHRDDLGRLDAILTSGGVSPRSIARAREMKTLVMIEPVRSDAVRAALEGRSGVEVVRNYAGVPVLSAYGPLQVEGLRWAILAEMEVDEAYQPVRSFGRKVLAYSAGIIVVVTILATALTPGLVRPVRRLADGAKRVGEGELDVEVVVRGHDEFRELADAFNGMTRSLKAKSALIDQKVRENEELLLNILPGPIAARRKGDDDKVSEAFADVSVLFADIVGFTELTEALKPEVSVSLLNELIGAIDEAAERLGVEKVKTYGSTYMAVCGLSMQRPDHTDRVVELATDILRIVRRFNQEHSATLAAEVGVNAGPVTGGIVGRSKFLYDLWGDTVNVARGIKAETGPNTVVVTAAVKDRLRETHSFDGPVEVMLRGKGAVAAWTVKG